MQRAHTRGLEIKLRGLGTIGQESLGMGVGAMACVAPRRAVRQSRGGLPVAAKRPGRAGHAQHWFAGSLWLGPRVASSCFQRPRHTIVCQEGMGAAAASRPASRRRTTSSKVGVVV